MLFGLFTKENIDFKELVKQEAVIVDVRSKAEFENGHVEKAINIPLDTLPSNLKKLGNKDTIIITCCASGNRSAIAKNFLQSAGYNNVYNGGGWNKLKSKLK